MKTYRGDKGSREKWPEGLNNALKKQEFTINSNSGVLQQTMLSISNLLTWCVKPNQEQLSCANHRANSLWVFRLVSQ